MEAHTIADVKHPRQRIRSLPTGREPRLQIEVFVLPHQRVIDQRADALALGIGALAKIEIVGRAFNDEL